MVLQEDGHRAEHRAYWHYDADRQQNKSQYYAYTADGQEDYQINSQHIQYYADTRNMQWIKTWDAVRMSTDSTHYTYNTDSVRIQTDKYILQPNGEYDHWLSVRYEKLDATQRRQVERIYNYLDGEIDSEVVYVYQYTYDAAGQLTERIKHRVWSDGKRDPQQRLVQEYDAEGRITQVQTYRATEDSSDDWWLQSEHTYTYSTDGEIREVQNFHPSGKVQQHTWRRKTYLPGTDKMLTMELFEDELTEKNRYRVDTYFYSE